VEKTGERRPWKSQERFPLSHSFNNNKLDDRDHFQQNAKTSVASLRGLIGSSRNLDRHHSRMLIAFIGIPNEHFHTFDFFSELIVRIHLAKSCHCPSLTKTPFMVLSLDPTK
jgi:hypothetical protein